VYYGWEDVLHHVTATFTVSPTVSTDPAVGGLVLNWLHVYTRIQRRARNHRPWVLPDCRADSGQPAGAVRDDEYDTTAFGPNRGDLEGRPTARARSHGWRARSRAEDETGALLILALVFLVVISALCASLSLWATNNLNNTGTFATALSLQSASNSVTQLAVQDVRYNFIGLDAQSRRRPSRAGYVCAAAGARGPATVRRW
jgi:hypothetical protein